MSLSSASAGPQAPLQPRAILRGHGAAVHAARFVRRGSSPPEAGAGQHQQAQQRHMLLTGDADGWVVAWDLATRRPRAVWRAHEGTVLGVGEWAGSGGETGRIITHGRDHKLLVWRLREEDEERMSTALPLEQTTEPRPKPWLLHVLDVNAMNFCEYASCPVTRWPERLPRAETGGDDSGLLIAVPNTLASEAVDIFHLPSQRRIHTVRPSSKPATSLPSTARSDRGMVMALALFYLDGQLTLCIGYESGLAVVVQLVDDEGTWKDLYNAKPHSQPILSLDVDTDGRFFLTSGADALVAKHPLPGRSVSSPAVGESAAPAAPAATTPAVHEPASSNPPSASRTPGQTQSLLSAALASSSPPSGPDLTRPPSTQAPTEVIENAPLKVVNTKHAGQQGLRIRRFTSTGNSARATAIFATAGWDGRARVYSTRTLRELAVLAWHRTGCFAVAFADVDDEDGGDGDEKQGRTADEGVRMDAPANSSRQTAVVPRPRLVDVTVRERRLRAAESTHWLAVGGKDGKVTLWDVY